MGAREKLNSTHIIGSLGVAGVLGVLTSSWIVFAVAGTLMVAAGVCSGDIRLCPCGSREKSLIAGGVVTATDGR